MFRAQRCERQKVIRARWRDICEICKKRLPSGYWKIRHMQIHRKEIEITGRKYHCTNCNKRFKEIANYVRHCAFHSVIKSQQTNEHANNKCIDLHAARLHGSIYLFLTSIIFPISNSLLSEASDSEKLC